jgi:hypothetical protein
MRGYRNIKPMRPLTRIISGTAAAAFNIGIALLCTGPSMFSPAERWFIIISGGVIGATSSIWVLWLINWLARSELRHLPPIACHECAYDLAGLPAEARCPMCGSTERITRTDPIPVLPTIP